MGPWSRRAAALAGTALGIVGCFSSKEYVASRPEGDAGAEASAAEDAAPEAMAKCEPLPPRLDAPTGPPPPDGRPTSAFVIDQAKDTARDTATGLVWQRAPNASRKYDDAQCYCEGLDVGGDQGWRMPTRYELMGIVDYALDAPPVDGPAVDPKVFHDVHPGYFWTSTRYGTFSPSQPLLPVLVGIGDGRTEAGQGGAEQGEFWCVRGAVPAPPAKRFVSSSQTVKDVVTGYVWERGVDPRKWADVLGPEMDAYCTGLVLDGLSSFRMPTVKELQTLVIAGTGDPCIDKAAFPGTPSVLFHSSSHYVGKTTSMVNWTVDFSDGRTHPNNGSLSTKAVRCVRTP